MKKAAFTAGIIAVLLIYGIGIIKLSEKENSAEAAPSAENTHFDDKYIVKEHKGKIALFLADEAIPLKYLDIDISNLREYDRNQFKTGVTLESLHDVLMLEEDFSN